MAIEAKLLVDDAEVGNIIAMRINPVEEPEPDDMCTYTWTVEMKGEADRSSNDRGVVQHRHGDGPWSLVARVVFQAGLR